MEHQTQDARLFKSGEDYLEAILEIEQRNGKVRSVDVANLLGVSRPSVSRAMNVLQEKGYISKPTYGEVTITPLGRARAESVARRHAALQRLLIEVLGVSEETAKADACKIEHDISIETTDKLTAFLQTLPPRSDRAGD